MNKYLKRLLIYLLILFKSCNCKAPFRLLIDVLYCISKHFSWMYYECGVDDEKKTIRMYNKSISGFEALKFTVIIRWITSLPLVV